MLQKTATQKAALKMEDLIAKSPKLAVYDKAEDAYQEIEKFYVGSATYHTRDKEIYRVR